MSGRNWSRADRQLGDTLQAQRIARAAPERSHSHGWPHLSRRGDCLCLRSCCFGPGGCKCEECPTPESPEVSGCQQCGKPVGPLNRGRPRRFCSVACRGLSQRRADPREAGPRMTPVRLARKDRVAPAMVRDWDPPQRARIRGLAVQLGEAGLVELIDAEEAKG